MYFSYIAYQIINKQQFKTTIMRKITLAVLFLLVTTLVFSQDTLL